jgi:hypothetical protein
MQLDNIARVLHFQRKKDMKLLYSTLQTKDLYGYVIKSMDDYIYFQKIPLFLQEVNTKWYLSHK